MKNFNDEPQRSQQPEQNGAERQNLPQFDNKPLIVKDYNIVVFFIYNLIFAPLAALVFLYIGDIFPYYTPFVFVAFAVISYLNSVHTRFVHLTNRSINYVNKGKITKSIKFDEISLIKLTATPLFGHIVPARNSAGIVFSFIVIAVAFAGFLQSLRGFIIFIMSLTALVLPFFIAKLIFSKITEGKFSFRAIDTLIIYDGKGEFISFMMSGKDFERVCRYMLKERQISPSKFQKQFVIFQ
ncbi:hypothetical protein [uncultured Campylobacter sp.]|uniref:hypothetical protein n=1 Tax=uncultured Campylobacter sp. TaxID=218934 RepID=UPI00263519D5|nr:hypothetical protein [uncultured Campylobacter sp.]